MHKFSLSYDPHMAYSHVKSFFKDVCRSTQSPLADNILRLIREDKDLELSRLEILPSAYSEVNRFADDYALVSFLSKWKGLKTGVDTKMVALEAFERQELVCKANNERLTQRNSAFVEPILHRAQRLIAAVLGPFSVERLAGLERWGPGATTDMSRSRAYLDTKITDFPIPVTARARGKLATVIQNDLHWSFCILGQFPEGEYSLLPHCFTTVRGSRITTVSKTAKTDRTIAIEPRGNMFLQKAPGKWIRRRLKRVGVDLDDQTLNQKLAALCEEYGLATIDLAMASDSIVFELVYELLPIDWAVYLDDIRSPEYQFDGASDWHRFEKFSSMGNGFTFELESLIFWALTKASMDDEDGRFAVYGDDIILPKSDAHVLISTLAYCGFRTNDQKSFLEGDFYESCGKHYFKGIDVTPPYQKEELVDLMSSIRFNNRVARYLVRRAVDDKLISPWLKPWKRSVCPHLTRGAPSIPFGTEGDDGYLVNHELAGPLRHKRSYGSQWKVAKLAVVRIPANEAALLAYALRQGVITESPDGGDLISRERSSRYSITTRWIEPSWEFALD